MLWFICHKNSIKVFYSWNMQECIPYDSNIRNIQLLKILLTFYRLDMLLNNAVNNPIPCPVPKAIFLYKILREPLKGVIIIPWVLAMRSHVSRGLLSLRGGASRPNMCIKLLDSTKLSCIIDGHGVKVNHLNFADFDLPILWVLPRVTLV